MSRIKKLFSNTIIFGIGQFGSKLLVYFLMPLYTAILSTEEYGVADLITNSANLLIPFAGIGISSAVFRFAMDKNEDKKEIFSSGITFLSISCLIFAIISPLLNFVSFISDYVLLIVFYVLASNFHTICAEYIRAIGKTKLFALQGILGTALTIAFNLLYLIPMKMGIVGYVLSVASADFVGTIFLIIVAKLYRDFSIKSVSKSKFKTMLKYGLPLMPTGIIWWVTNVSDRYFVAFMVGESANGIYSAGYKIPTLITLASTVFFEAWQLSSVKDTDNEIDRKAYFEAVTPPFSAFMMLVSAILILLSKPLTKFLLASSYFEASEYMPILLLATVFCSFVTFLGSRYNAEKKTAMVLVSATVGAVLNIGLNALMIPRYGAQGAGIATLISYFVVYVIRVIDIKIRMPFKMGLLSVGISSLLTVIEILIALEILPFGYIGEIAVILVMILVNIKNFKPIFDIISTLLKRKNKKI